MHVFLSVIAPRLVSLKSHFKFPHSVFLHNLWKDFILSFCLFFICMSAYILVQTQRKEYLCYVAVFLLLGGWEDGPKSQGLYRKRADRRCTKCLSEKEVIKNMEIMKLFLIGRRELLP